jgi:two-component sensor histidine kinase
VTHRGFERDFLEFFREVSTEDASSSGRCLGSGESVSIEDVLTDAPYEPFRGQAATAGFRAVHSTPLLGRSGEALGVLSLHFRNPHRASGQDVRRLELYVRQAVDFIERHRFDTELRASLNERDALLKELHHRVKNNLQVVMSLLEMQGRHAPDPRVTSSLSEARNRITAIAAIHEMLYQSGSFSRVDLGRYARRLVPHVVSLYQQESRVKIAVTGEGITVDLARAVPFALLLNELVSNACKHAFPSDEGGELTITLEGNDRLIHVRVTDNGVGLKEGFDHRPAATLGIQLVRMLAKQLGGTVAFTSARGTTVDIELPVDPVTV